MLILLNFADAQKGQHAKDAKANIILQEKVTCASICMPKRKRCMFYLKLAPMSSAGRFVRFFTPPTDPRPSNLGVLVESY